MAIDPQNVLRRAEHAYEMGRARRAAMLASPLSALCLIGACLGTTPVVAVGLGAVLLALAWLFLWRGQSLGRSVFPGVLAGLVPLALAVGARTYGHMCTGITCTTLCIPACTVGGALAGFLIAYAGRNAASRGSFLLGAGALAALVGTLGCSCVGIGGVAGLALGLVATVLPASLGRAGKIAS